jgi:hypothetical protein
MAGHSPSKTGVNALSTRPSTRFGKMESKTWITGSSPVMTADV